MRLSDVVETSAAVARTSGRLEKIEQLAALLTKTPPAELPIVVTFLSGEIRQGRIGIGGAMLSSMRDVPPARDAELDLREVDATFDRLAAATGHGSSDIRARLLRQLFERATPGEQDFLVRLLFGELRQGALEGVLVDAVGRAAGLPAARIRRAAMLAGDLSIVARPAMLDGEEGLSAFTLQLFKPVQPMLADSAAMHPMPSPTLGEASLEYKLDGARIQAHKGGDEVRVYSRNLRDVTAAVPEVVSVVRALPARELVLDGEAIAMRPDGSPEPFQVTMRRFGRKLDVDRLRESLPITPYFFDVLYRDGAAIIDEPLTRRIAALHEVAGPDNLVPRVVTASPSEAAEFVRRALATGHEGVMAKALDAPYAAGRRGSAWLKIKQARTLDLVILAAEWGSGRRQGTLSNLHLGARDARARRLRHARQDVQGTDRRDAGVADHSASSRSRSPATATRCTSAPRSLPRSRSTMCRPAPQYPGGLTLRFARVKRYRSDKSGRRRRYVRDGPDDLPARRRDSRRQFGDSIRRLRAT